MSKINQKNIVSGNSQVFRFPLNHSSSDDTSDDISDDMNDGSSFSPSDSRSNSSRNSFQSEINSVQKIDWLYNDTKRMFESMFNISNKVMKGKLDLDRDKSMIAYTLKKAIESALNPDGLKLNDDDINRMNSSIKCFGEISQFLNSDNLKAPTPVNLSRRNSVTAEDFKEFIKKTKGNQLSNIVEEQEDESDHSLTLDAIASLENKLSKLASEQKNEREYSNSNNSFETEEPNEVNPSNNIPDKDVIGNVIES